KPALNTPGRPASTTMAPSASARSSAALSAATMAGETAFTLPSSMVTVATPSARSYETRRSIPELWLPSGNSRAAGSARLRRVADVGPLALVGSGEYTPAMLEVEAGLLVGRPPRYVQIPTAASAEGPERLDYWVRLGQAQAARLGVEAVPLVVRTREEAADPAIVAQVAGAGLIYLSGGSPTLLARVLRDTPLWNAIVAEWR